MRAFWDARARENAAWYVDTSCDYDAPDMERFFETGRKVVQAALLDAPARPAGRGEALEIGAGIGRVCAALADHFDHVTGMDISPEMVERATSLVADTRVAFLVGDGTSLRPVPDGSVDFVVTFTVLQHLTDRSLVTGYLREAARVLRPGGVLAAQWNNLPYPLGWRLRGAWWRGRAVLPGGPPVDPRADRAFTGTRVPYRPVERALTGAGLQVAGTSGLGSLFAWVWATKPAAASR